VSTQRAGTYPSAVVRRPPLPLLAASLALLAGCALQPRSLDALPEAPPASQAADGPALEERAKQAWAESEARPDDADVALAATALLFQAADLRLQRGSLEALDALEAPDLAAVLGADERVDDVTREAVLSLCTAGLEAAERAAALRPGDVAAELHRGLHLSLVSWANGPARSLMAGYGPRLVAAIDAALAADATFDDAAPLRLDGRFRGKAPWPYGDLARARASLERACEAAPITVNLLFLGDVLWAAGARDEALARWRAASTAEGDASTRWSQPLLRELAARRLATATP